MLLAVWLAHRHLKHSEMHFLNSEFLGYCEVPYLNQMGLNCISGDLIPKIVREASPAHPLPSHDSREDLWPLGGSFSQFHQETT